MSTLHPQEEIAEEVHEPMVAVQPAPRPAIVRMRRTTSQDIREGTEDLKEAAEQSLNVILDLGLDGVVRWVSPSWTDVVGTTPDVIQGKPIADLVLDNKTAFADAIANLQQDASRSQFIRFAVALGPLSKLTPSQSPTTSEDREDALEDSTTELEPAPEPELAPPQMVLALEGQGIMVYDRTTHEESHVCTGDIHFIGCSLLTESFQTMWMIRPWVPPREITIDLPSLLVDSLGVGAEILAQYLTALAEAGANDPGSLAPPLPILCRICERQIQPWWFEKHTDLCMQEHRAEMEVELAQESLVEHRVAIVRILEALESRGGRPTSGELSALPAPPVEYKGLPIGPASTPSSGPSSGLSSGAVSPAASRSRSREPSVTTISHGRTRSFAVRRPLSRIVELVLDLCDTAIEIDPAALRSSPNEDEDRTEWTKAESRLTQVLQWQSPSTTTLEQERGLAALCADTEAAARAKVHALLRHRRILEYAERIRLELSLVVQECVDAALRKAAELAAGESSSDSTDTTDGETEDEAAQVPLPADDDDDTTSIAPDDTPAELAVSVPELSNVSDASLHAAWERRPSIQTSSGSTGSNSPRGCPTPRSHRGAINIAGASSHHPSKRSSHFFESDVGDSDSSIRSSSILSSLKRTESPASEYGLSRASSGRDRKRHSMMLHDSIAALNRQSSPGKDIIPPPRSPVQLNKLRISGTHHELAPSPITSPLLTTSEIHSPVMPIGSYGQHSMHSHSSNHHPNNHHHHHRRQSSTTSGDVNRPPLSPRLVPVNQPQARAVPPSIKDFEIIKPISKGAFGSVYLSKKKTTGDYFAIKVLKKADMVAKNQVTNVKAERAIMMRQGESDYVAKLYWTFSSKDYLYLVMEYLNGGDCASLIKSLAGLPEDWVKRYLAEVVLCVHDLHTRGIVHRDLKPDNLLIDQKGHLKLTDFGLSRMGLVGRQKRVLNSKDGDAAPDLLKQGPFITNPSVTSSRSASFDLHGNTSATSTPHMTADVTNVLSQPSYFCLSRESSTLRDPSRRTSGYRSDSGGSESLTAMFNNFNLGEPSHFAFSPRNGLPSTEPHSAGSGSPDPYPTPSLESQSSLTLPLGTSPKGSMMPPPMALFDPQDTGRRFVGTPDYLAPETINGVGQDEMSDWWSLGCILFEFLYGYPPFHAETPDKVFENILQRRIDWPDDEDCPVSPEAKDLMNRLMCLDPRQRLGANAEEKYPSGGDEIRSHPWFAGTRWETLYEEEAQFVPAPGHPEDTEYFDSRGATLQAFTEEVEDPTSSPARTPGVEHPERPHDALSKGRISSTSSKRGLIPLHIPPHVRDSRTRRLSEPVPADDFGTFTFKNLPVLEKANKDVLQKLRAGTAQAQSRTGSMGSQSHGHSPAPSLEGSPVFQVPLKRQPSASKSPNRPPSPVNGGESAMVSPNRASQPTSPLLVSFSASQHHQRRKTSSTSSGVSHQSAHSLQPGSFFDIPRLASTIKAHSTASSPIKHAKVLPTLPASPQKAATSRPVSVSASSRARSQTLGSQESDSPVRDLWAQQQKRRSGVFEVSPSSSDNEEAARASALLRVQRRRQSSRRKSRNIVLEGPVFRPLDVLIAEDHPVSRMVMERLLEKMLCHTITVSNGPDAIRYATSEIKFDIILMEFRLPQINGADVARMIRDTKNANSQTPIVAVTGYLKELQTPNHFDALIEKPPTTAKLSEVIGQLCQWRPPPPGHDIPPLRVPPSSGLRNEFARHGDSPSSTSSGFPSMPGATFRGSSREDSVSSSFFGDFESVNTDEGSLVMNRLATDDWRDRGLGILQEAVTETKQGHPHHHLPTLLHQQSAPPILPSKLPIRQRSAEKIRAKRETLEKQRHECDESGDDEDEELGDVQVRAKSPHRKEHRTSKLGIEMLRTNSRGSVVSTSETLQEGGGGGGSGGETVAVIPEEAVFSDDNLPATLTPPERFLRPGSGSDGDGQGEIDMSITPKSSMGGGSGGEEEPTPRALSTVPLVDEQQQPTPRALSTLPVPEEP
ncbi:MAG: hypothetical protein M1823_003852 [Watsoniomyces obsoletus]|nr:MAG: hypothetical protein M1823_003852 [Watsoniomyces obsoletus]